MCTYLIVADIVPVPAVACTERIPYIFRICFSAQHIHRRTTFEYAHRHLSPSSTTQADLSLSRPSPPPFSLSHSLSRSPSVRPSVCLSVSPSLCVCVSFFLSSVTCNFCLSTTARAIHYACCWDIQQPQNNSSSNRQSISGIFFFFFFFFCVPQLYLWGSPFLGEIFACHRFLVQPLR